jgi:formamidopyrimidine-DNA glycosylase
MPELPEVETIVRGLQKRVPGAVISKVSVKHPDILTGSTVPAFQKALRGRTIQKVERRAKNIVIRLDNGSTLIVNLGMTGRLVAGDPAKSTFRYVAVRMDLQDGRVLLYASKFLRRITGTAARSSSASSRCPTRLPRTSSTS